MKITLIGAEKAPQWKSCQSIVGNLFKSYESHLGRGAKVLRFDQSMMHHFAHERGQYLKSFAQSILSGNPDVVIFVGDFPLPPLILAELVRFNRAAAEKIQFLVHVFGDFPLRLGEWRQAAPFIEGLKIRFVAASDRQKDFIHQFLSVPDVEICPFPIDSERFYFDSAIRKKARKKMGLGPKEKLYAYTGRLSLLKNIRSLMGLFAEAAAKDPDAQFVFAGGFDDLISPIFRSGLVEGQYFQMVQEVWTQLPQDTRRRIRFLGDLNSASLNELLNAADIYCSLSLYQDEDYGMAPAEALCCGLPMLLSDWGGYSSFTKHSPHVRLVSPFLMNEGFFFSLDHVMTQFNTLKPLSEDERKKSAESSQKTLNIAACSKILKSLYHEAQFQPFGGFTDQVGALDNALKDDGERLTFASVTYRWLYESYYRERPRA